jgi:hypothetical protein
VSEPRPVTLDTMTLVQLYAAHRAAQIHVEETQTAYASAATGPEAPSIPNLKEIEDRVRRAWAALDRIQVELLRRRQV